jgi:hypothetical protein
MMFMRLRQEIKKRREEQAQQRVSEEASICIRDVNGTAILLLGLSLFPP